MNHRGLASFVSASVIALLLPAVAAAGPLPPPAPGALLGSTGNVGGTLIDIDPATGLGTPRGPLGDFGPVTEIEFRADGTLFGTTGQGSSHLITIDPATGAESLVGTHPFGAINGLEFVGDTLYGGLFAPKGGFGEGGSPYFLVIVDTTDASLTPVGSPLPLGPVRGLAYDADAGVMYGVAPPLNVVEGVGDVLFTIDLTTAAVTPIGQVGFALGSLEFGPDGLLYGGAVSGGDGQGSAPLVIVDTATGNGTVVGPTGFSGISGLAFVPGGGEVVPIQAIPTLSRGALLLLAALVAAAALWAVARR